MLPRKDFTPKEVFSPSQLDTYTLCNAKWGYRYLAGYSAPLSKAAALGTQIHDQIAKHLWGEPLDINSEPARRAIAGLHHIVDLDEASRVEVEGVCVQEYLHVQKNKRPEKLSIKIDTAPFLPGIEPLQFVGYRDLALHFSADRNGWYQYDHKSCRTFQYQLTSDQLAADTQGLIYSLDLIQNKGVQTVPSRWIYYKTSGRPESRTTDFEFTADHVFERMPELLEPAIRMREHVRLHTLPDTLTKNFEACSAYGGCPYHSEVGGPCNRDNYNPLGDLFDMSLNGAPQSLAERLAARRAASHASTPQPEVTPAVVPSPAPVAVMMPPPPVAAAPVAIPKPPIFARTPIMPPEAMTLSAPVTPPAVDGESDYPSVPDLVAADLSGNAPDNLAVGFDGSGNYADNADPEDIYLGDTNPANPGIVLVPKRRGRKPGVKNRPKSLSPVANDSVAPVSLSSKLLLECDERTRFIAAAALAYVSGKPCEMPENAGAAAKEAYTFGDALYAILTRELPE